MSARKIMLLRHAEKPDLERDVHGVDASGREDSRELSVRGWQRAATLVQFFAPRNGHFQHHLIETPQAIFAASAYGRSLRPLRTVQPLAQMLGLVISDEFAEDRIAPLVTAAEACADVVLISWRHDSMAAIARALIPDLRAPREWDPRRFDVVWVFCRVGDRWTFEQVPQLLLPGDRADPID
jgi:hypothetical protein